MAMLELTEATFEATVIGHEIVLVDFWAAWCEPCHQFAAVFEGSAQAHPDVVHATVDTEAEPALAELAGITALPTLMAFRDGILVFNQAGALPADAMAQVVRAIKALDMDVIRAQMAARGE